MSAIGKLYYGLRTRGVGYLLRVIPNEIANPRLGVTAYIRSALIRLLGIVHRSSSSNAAWSRSCLQFFYDLSASPLTFDFAGYLAAAEVERRTRGLAGINVIFVLGSYDGVRREEAAYDAAIDRVKRLGRLRNVLIPMLSLLPSVRSYAVCAERDAAAELITANQEQLYPRDYRVFLPRQPSPRVIHEHARRKAVIWPLLCATEHGRRIVREFLDREAIGRLPVVITLRHYDYSPARNSRSEDWIAFASALDPNVYAPIFVHDTETAMRRSRVDVRGHILCEAATWNLEVRMALYEAAWLNMALMHGPLELCWYNERVRYLLFINLGTAPETTEARLIENGHRIGQDLVFARPWQRLIWGADQESALRREFHVMELQLRDLEGIGDRTQ